MPFHRTTVQALLAEQRVPMDETVVDAARVIIDDVREHGTTAIRRLAEQYDGLPGGKDLLVGAAGMEQACDDIAPDTLQRLERTAARIRTFADAQRDALLDIDVPIPGGRAGHRFRPVDRAGCYGPGGRHPLPSSVLMTVIAARAAGVEDVWVASPNPQPVVLAAARVAGADGVLACGGAHAVAALTFGIEEIQPRDVVVGPGNAYVTAAKAILSDRVSIDMLAGPSELVILADESADPALLAADLLAQAEHDVQALPVLVTDSAPLAEAVRGELDRQLTDLPTANTASVAVGRGGAVVVGDLDEGADVCNQLAPEHLQVIVQRPSEVVENLRHYGGLFIGPHSAEVLGDYGAGPNHVLPTMGTARQRAGLSVLTFLRAQTWMEITDPSAARQLHDDAEGLAREEGLVGHARALRFRSA